MLARHSLRPFEAVLLHDGCASRAGSLADTPANGQRLVVILQADGRVHAAQEELEVRRAFDLHQGPELVHLQARFVLGLMVHFVGEGCHVVANAPTHWYGDLLASQIGILGYGWHSVTGCGTRVQAVTTHAHSAHAVIRTVQRSIRSTRCQQEDESQDQDLQSIVSHFVRLSLVRLCDLEPLGLFLC